MQHCILTQDLTLFYLGFFCSQGLLMQHCILTGLTLFYHCFFCSQGLLMQHCILTDLFLFYLCFFCTVVKWGLPPNGCNPILTLLLLQLRMANAALHPNPEFNQYCIKFASYVLQLKIADAALHPIPGFNPIPPLLLLQLTIAEAELQTNSVFNPTVFYIASCLSHF